MARTRTSDQTLRHRHAKPQVYACLLAVIVAPGATPALGARGRGMGPREGQGAGRPGPEAVPCVACQVLSVAPAQLGALPDRLAGVTVAVRVSPGANAAAGVRDIARRGGRAALHVTGVPSESDP